MNATNFHSQPDTHEAPHSNTTNTHGNEHNDSRTSAREGEISRTPEDMRKSTLTHHASRQS